ncbi:MAG: ABC transporter permease [Firmicutes bacterium]|nr:ABC transporter permease [Bacillota bacterium]
MLTVFKFEFLTAVKKKSFIISMAIMFAATLLFSFIPKLLSGINFSEPKPYGIVSDKDYIDEAIASEITGKDFIKYESLDEMNKAIINGELDGGIEIVGENRNLRLKSSSATTNYDKLTRPFEELEKREALKELGLNEGDIERVNRNNYYEITSLETDGAKNFWFAYVFLFVLYFLIVMFGNQVAMAIAREKSDRTMELLITSAKPKDLITGKVAAYGLLGIISMLVLYLGVFLGTKIGGDASTEMIAALNLSEMVQIDQMIVSFSFFVVGYILYLYVMAASASLVSKLEDINYAIQPIMLIFVISFFVSFSGMTSPGPVLTIASFIPFSSPFAMIARYIVTSVPTIEVLISFAILVVSTIALRWISIKLYKLGSYNYGNKVKFFKSLFTAIKD